MFGEFIIFLICTVLFSMLLCLISALIAFKVNSNLDKFNLYECGFKSFDNTTRNPLTIDFYLISLLFVIFDMETVVLIPWLINFQLFDYSTLWLVYSFIFILIIGYIYEIKLGLFDWLNTEN